MTFFPRAKWWRGVNSAETPVEVHEICHNEKSFVLKLSFFLCVTCAPEAWNGTRCLDFVLALSLSLCVHDLSDERTIVCSLKKNR